MTHCFELLNQISKNCPDIDLVKANYTAEGIYSEVVDRYDGQIYVLTIKPKREE